MEPCSVKNQKIQTMKSYKRAKIVYNLVLYTLTSIITCFFFSSPFWFPSISTHFVFSSILDKAMFCFINPKCFFVVGNLIVLILVGESKLKQSSPSPDMYEEYVARSRSSGHHKTANGSEKTLIVGEKIHRHEDGVVMRSCKNQVCGETEKPRIKKEEQLHEGLRSSKSVVWGESGMVKSEKIIKGKKKDGKVGTMRSSKSAVWGEGGMVKMEKGKGKKEEPLHDQAKIKPGMRSSNSAVWGESDTVKMEKVKGEKEEKFVKEEVVLVESEIVARETDKGEKEEEFSHPSVKDEEKKMGMRSCRSAVWGKGKKEEEIRHDDGEEKKMGMRSCRSEIWSEGEIVRLGKIAAKEEEEQQLHMLNKRVEDFIARVNKQRLIV
ncbi:golgin subfamily A member 6-like protein 1 [Salvia divinorum]|uniref:Golgin subfamily A member 6-like protein 1 n=1 Tax=Salvia divinorum TaxID=28513 RepID=A0ABD1H243_SALDI